jgi:hypothetical protein
MARTKVTGRMASTMNMAVIKVSGWRLVVDTVYFCRDDDCVPGSFHISFIFAIEAKISGMPQSVVTTISLPELHQDNLKPEQKAKVMLCLGKDLEIAPTDGEEVDKQNWCLKMKHMKIEDEYFTTEQLRELKSPANLQDAEQMKFHLQEIILQEPIVATNNDDIFRSNKRKLEMRWNEWLKVKPRMKVFDPSTVRLQSSAKAFSDSDDSQSKSTAYIHEVICILLC